MGVEVKTELKGVDKLQKRFSQNNLDKAVLGSMTDLGHEWEREAKFNLSNNILKVRTGNFRSHVVVETKVKGSSINTTLYTQGVPYAPAHEFGAKIQVPEKSRPFDSGLPAWHFFTKDGTEVYTRHIKAHTIVIPERKPLRLGLQQALKNAQKIFNTHFERNFKNA